MAQILSEETRYYIMRDGMWRAVGGGWRDYADFDIDICDQGRNKEHALRVVNFLNSKAQPENVHVQPVTITATIPD